MTFWVLGTDTGVGKTLVSALILNRYGLNCALAYWKPVSTGGHSDRDRKTVDGWLGVPVPLFEESYLFDPPVSPHLAARLSGAQISPE